jgi:hypothetical protein
MAEDTSAEHHELPVEWYIPDDMVSQYATNMLVQMNPHEFIISFFQLYPPPVLGSPEEQKAKLAAMTSVRATCVSRVIVAAERMPEFVRVLQETLARYTSTREKSE